MLFIKISSFLACLVLIYADSSDNDVRLDILTYPKNHQQIEVGSSLELRCSLNTYGKVWWMKDDRNITPRFAKSPAIFEKSSVEIEDTGDYVCTGKTTDESLVNEIIHVSVIEPPTIPEGDTIRASRGSSATIGCNINGRSLKDWKWEKLGEPEKTESLNKPENILFENGTVVVMKLKWQNVRHEDNGTYVCSAKSAGGEIKSSKYLLVTDTPEIGGGIIKAVGADSVYLNWTINYHNDNVTQYNIESNRIGDTSWEPTMDEIGTESSSFVLKGLEPNTTYRVRIQATNSVGASNLEYYKHVTTLEEDPEFVPTFTIPQTTNESITVEFSKPPSDLKHFDYYYSTSVQEDGVNTTQTSYSDLNAERVIIEGLKAKTTYRIKVSACNYYTKVCGGSSLEEEVLTVHKNAANSSANSHPRGVIFIAINTVSLYFSIKYLIT